MVMVSKLLALVKKYVCFLNNVIFYVKTFVQVKGCFAYQRLFHSPALPFYFLALKYKMSATGFAQVDARNKFYVVIASSTIPRYAAAANQVSNTSTDLTTSDTYATGNVLFDCGKRVTVVDSTSGMAKYVYALVSKVYSASDEEGRNESRFYVRVFDYSGSALGLARLG